MPNSYFITIPAGAPIVFRTEDHPWFEEIDSYLTIRTIENMPVGATLQIRSTSRDHRAPDHEYLVYSDTKSYGLNRIILPWHTRHANLTLECLHDRRNKRSPVKFEFIVTDPRETLLFTQYITSADESESRRQVSRTPGGEWFGEQRISLDDRVHHFMMYYYDQGQCIPASPGYLSREQYLRKGAARQYIPEGTVYTIRAFNSSNEAISVKVYLSTTIPKPAEMHEEVVNGSEDHSVNTDTEDRGTEDVAAGGAQGVGHLVQVRRNEHEKQGAAQEREGVNHRKRHMVPEHDSDSSAEIDHCVKRACVDGGTPRRTACH